MPWLATLFALFSIKSSSAAILKFPAGFKWCVATAGHQVEGGDVSSDWADWEKGHFSSGLPHIKNGEVSGLTDDHWNHLESDTALLVDLGVGTYRFSIEWSKIEPAEGQYDLEAVAHYRREIALLHEKGINPMITLHHYTLPMWVAQKGGWDWKGIVDAFSRYTTYVYNNIAPDNRDFITLNEPTIQLGAGWVLGVFPPGKTDLSIINPLTHMLEAHAASYHILHDLADARGAPIRVGIAHHLRIFDPYNHFNILERIAAGTLDEFFNWTFINAADTGQIHVKLSPHNIFNKKIKGLSHSQDFIGLNYYSRDIVKVNLFAKQKIKIEVKEGAPVSDEGWEIYPEGIYRLLKEMNHRYPKRPIFITENGIADGTDAQRPKFIYDHLKFVHQAIQEGVTVEGYCHWSSMDNFEWNMGTGPRFGLYSVDYATETRIPRASALLFSKIAADNAIASDYYFSPMESPIQAPPPALMQLPGFGDLDDLLFQFFMGTL